MALFVPLDGRITSQNVLNGVLTGTEVMEIVSPGNAAQGNTYQIALDTLATFFGSGGGASFKVYNVTSGATSGSPFDVPTDANVVLLNKGAASPSYLTFPLAASMTSLVAVLVKDRNGDAFTNNITISFTGGEDCDGQPSIVLNNNYAWARVAPYPTGGGWYQC